MRPSTPQDAQAIIALMRQAGLQPHVEPEHLHWKYWRERPDWPGSRSFVLVNERDVLAHIALVPGSLRWVNHSVRIVHPIDWAARRGAVGAGVRLMKHVGGMSDFLVGIGGSRDTLRIMPLMGYRHIGVVHGYVRTISPWGILQRPSSAAWKRPARIARSAFWTLSAPKIDLNGWQARVIGVDELERLATVLPAPRSGCGVFERSSARLRHALACPIVPVELYALERAGRLGGYFLLSYAPGQARLADLWMNSEDPADWRAAIESAVERAKRRGGVAELVGWASDPVLAGLLQECGFRERLSLPIYFWASGGQTLPEANLRVHMLDNDAYYLYFGRNELWA